MTQTAATATRTANMDVLMGDTVIVQGHLHVVVDEPTYVTSRGHQMVRWVLRPAAGSRGVVDGPWEVWPRESTNVVA